MKVLSLEYLKNVMFIFQNCNTIIIICAACAVFLFYVNTFKVLTSKRRGQSNHFNTLNIFHIQQGNVFHRQYVQENENT